VEKGVGRSSSEDLEAPVLVCRRDEDGVNHVHNTVRREDVGNRHAGAVDRGVWDTLSNDQAVACVDAALALGSANPAEVLVKKAFDAGSDDNITAAVIIFEKDETVV